ncbi:MAG: hypothetical protein ACTS73_04195 [Arsenophonus sp. NEOnobi-MAG3]
MLTAVIISSIKHGCKELVAIEDTYRESKANRAKLINTYPLRSRRLNLYLLSLLGDDGGDDGP